MSKEHRCGSESVAAILHHPIHPMLVPFPIVTLIGALVTDLAYLATDNPFWPEASRWLLLVGIWSGLAAGLVGSIDYLGVRRARRLKTAHVHAAGNVLALVLAVVNLWVRGDGAAANLGTGLVLSAVTVAILGVTAWLGGELSYRHRIGVIASDSESASDLAVGAAASGTGVGAGSVRPPRAGVPAA